MSRDRFFEIRRGIVFHTCEQEEISQLEKHGNLLWCSRNNKGELQIQAMSHAVPTFVTTLDENSCRTKARKRQIQIYLASRISMQFALIAFWITIPDIFIPFVAMVWRTSQKICL